MVKSFPISSIEKVAKRAGCERISFSALESLRETLLEISEKIAIDAVAVAKHAKRVTVKREDIILATRK
ncbi:MAG: NFYB/HAP3 family transcription factor subunit [Candidatus Aenigmatarchaeota archaeon]